MRRLRITTIRISEKAYTKFMEVLGLMQYRKREKVSQAEAFDKILELVPKSWRRLLPEEEAGRVDFYILEEKVNG